MTPAKYTNAAQQRVLNTLKVLAELQQTGATPSEVASRLNTLRSNTTRDLANLWLAGLATRRNLRWYPRATP